MLTLSAVIIDVIIFLSIFNTGYSIKCQQCWSLVDPNCEAGNIEAKECEAEDEYCIKYVGKTIPRPMVFRDCNPVPVEQLCSIRIIEGHRIYVCYETCATDGCNGGAAGSAGSSHYSTSKWTIWITVAVVVTLWGVIMGQ